MTKRGDNTWVDKKLNSKEQADKYISQRMHSQSTVTGTLVAAGAMLLP
jgi:hypothetical protein